MIELVIGAVLVAAVAYGIYKVTTGKEPLDLNKDGKVDTADAKVVVEKAEKNVKKAVNKTATKVANKTSSRKKAK